MYPLNRNKLWKSNVVHVCEKCAMQYYWMKPKGRPKEFVDIVNSITSLRETGVVDEETYQHVMRLIISVYIQGEIGSKVTNTLDKALCEKLSPKNLFEALA